MSRILVDRPPGPGRRGPGPRTRARREQERARRRQTVVRLVVATLLVAGVAAVVGLIGPLGSRESKKASPAKVAQVTQQTWLLIGTVEADPSKEASWLMVFSWDLESKRGFVMYVPRSTLVEIPGYGGGPELVGKALALGREPTQISALSNLLGIRFDHFMKISDQSIQAFFDKFEGLNVDVEHKLTRKDPDGRVRTVFAEGKQHLDGKRAAEFLSFIDEQGDEIARAVRHTIVWSALFEKFRTGGGADAFRKLLSESKDLLQSDAEIAAVQKFLGRFVDAGPDEVQFETLPVQAQAIQAGSQLYAPDTESVARMVDRYLAGSRLGDGSREGRRVQILNGNGVPGIGEEVAAKLLPKGFKIVLGANARNFDYETTQIVIYSDSKKALALAGEIKDALGVGEVLISRQRQTIVDVTIVVGKDYLSKR